MAHTLKKIKNKIKNNTLTNEDIYHILPHRGLVKILLNHDCKILKNYLVNASDDPTEFKRCVEKMLSSHMPKAAEILLEISPSTYCSFLYRYITNEKNNPAEFKRCIEKILSSQIMKLINTTTRMLLKIPESNNYISTIDKYINDANNNPFELKERIEKILSSQNSCVIRALTEMPTNNYGINYLIQYITNTLNDSIKFKECVEKILSSQKTESIKILIEITIKTPDNNYICLLDKYIADAGNDLIKFKKRVEKILSSHNCMAIENIMLMRNNQLSVLETYLNAPGDSYEFKERVEKVLSTHKKNAIEILLKQNNNSTSLIEKYIIYSLHGSDTVKLKTSIQKILAAYVFKYSHALKNKALNIIENTIKNNSPNNLDILDVYRNNGQETTANTSNNNSKLPAINEKLNHFFFPSQNFTSLVIDNESKQNEISTNDSQYFVL